MIIFFKGGARLPLLLCASVLAGCSQSPDPGSGKDNSSAATRSFLKIEKVGDAGTASGGVLPGRVAFQPQAVTALGVPVQARIIAIHVRPGQIVTQGTPLMTLRGLDVAGARASLAQARARAAAAEDLLRRQNEMVKRGVGLEVERFGAETAAREARAELTRAQAATSLIGAGQGDSFTLRASAGGVILKLGANAGAIVSPDGEALVEIGDPRRLWIVADVPENAAGSIPVGRAADVKIPGADASYRAVVDGMGPVVDGEQRRLPLYLRLLNTPQQLAAGMLAEIRFEGGASDTISVPAEAVLIKDGARRIVYVQRADGKFEARPVSIGDARGGRVVITHGLRPGESIVVHGALLLDSSAEQQL